MNEPIVACKPPSVRACDALGCFCEERPYKPGPAPQAPLCKPGTHPECLWTTCVCVPNQDVPGVGGETVLPSDGCTLLLAIVAAGLKKSLVACWVDG